MGKDQEVADKAVSRRTVLASLGMAGAAAALGATIGVVGTSGSAYAAGVSNVVTIQELRLMTAPSPDDRYYVSDAGREGHFYYDPNDAVTPDNNGTVFVSAAGARFKRIMETEFTNVKWFGAKGDGATDDFDAIQAAIQAVFASGGGTVFFPRGTYIVSPYLNKWIALRNNVHLTGEGTNSIIKVKDNAGDYFTIFYGSASETLRNVRISNLKFDQNPANNTSCYIDLGRTDTNYFYQFCIISYRYENVTIDNVQFDPTCGVNSVSLNSETGHMATVTNCYFNFVMARGNGTYDNSAVYLNGRNHLVSNCVFRAGPGQKARGAIETHMGQSTVTNNVMEGYYTGVNLQAGGTGADDRCDMTVIGNTISNANQGIQIGPYKERPVRNITVSNNTITLANLVHNRVLTTGIANASWTSEQSIFENMNITGNTIVFQEELQFREGFTAMGYGIGFTHNSDISNLNISNNVIKNAPITGISVGSFQKIGVSSNVQITNNLIVNAGHYPTQVESYRSAITLRSTVRGARVTGNMISDTYPEAKGFCSVRINDAEGTYSDVEVTNNMVHTNQGGLWMMLSPSVRTDTRPRTHVAELYPPTEGSYEVGDVVWITGATTDGMTPAGCKAIAQGTAGTLTGVTGTGESGKFVLQVNNAADLRVGQWLKIGTQVHQIVRIAGTEVRLATALTAAVTGAAVTYAPPTWRTFGRVGSLDPVTDTSGATLAQLETELNQVKAILRTYGVVRT